MVLERDRFNLIKDQQQCTLQSMIDLNEEHLLIKWYLKMHSVTQKKKEKKSLLLLLWKLECF